MSTVVEPWHVKLLHLKNNKWDTLLSGHPYAEIKLTIILVTSLKSNQFTATNRFVSLISRIRG